MNFPIKIVRNIYFKVDELGISSTGYLTQHIESYLKSIDLKIVNKSSDSLSYWKGDFATLFRQKDFIDNGAIKVKIEGNDINIEIKSYTWELFVGGLIIGISASVTLWKIFPMAGLVAFFFIFGVNYVFRYGGQEDLEKQLRQMLEEL